MNTRTVRTAELQPGMVLAADLVDEHGQRLLGRDTVLNDRLIAVLCQRLDQVLIKEEAALEDTAMREARCRAVIANIERRFQHARGEPLMESLRDAVISHRRKEYGCDA